MRSKPSRRRAGKAVRAASRRKRKAAKPVPRKVVDPRVAKLLKVYAEAMRQFNKQNFRRARAAFQKVLSGPSRELAERARVHLVICEQRLERPAPPPLKSSEDHYHYAVSQINLGNYDAARTHLEKARKLSPKADHVHYALASVMALTGEAEGALAHLTQAIKLRPENRYHARNDDDFKLLEDVDRFQELVSPERLAGSST